MYSIIARCLQIIVHQRVRMRAGKDIVECTIIVFCSFSVSYEYYSAQTRTGIGLLGKPPAEKQFPTVASHYASYATRRKRRYEANQCG
jgi:hypothetical protein